MSALQTLLAGLFDYAGLYPPASLSLRKAASNYLQYRVGERAGSLGRFIINLDRLEEFREIAGDSHSQFRLSVIAGEDADWKSVAAQIGSGLRIEAFEFKCSDSHLIERTTKKTEPGVEIYFEVPIASKNGHLLHAIRAAGARAKLRMGGVVRDAIPSVRDVAAILQALADIPLPFKATAGLHHPLRSMQPLTYERQCPTGVTHGFVNLIGAAAILYSGGALDEAEQVLSEQDQTAWGVDESSLRWRDRTWTTAELAAVRREFLMSIGSCSFEEPIQDLKSLGWL